MQRPRPDLTEIKERQRLAWASGDYAMFGAALLIMSELLCEAVDLRPGQTVLDVATGSGSIVTVVAQVSDGAEATSADARLTRSSADELSDIAQELRELTAAFRY